MDAPLSSKQKRENMKFLFDELRKSVALRKDQRRKDALAKQQMDHKEQTHQAKLADMSVPPMMSKPTNPEAGPKDTVPALLAPGEAVIPAKAAQDPKNKPVIKAMVREGRSDRNLSVPKPQGMMCGTEKVKGYEWGSPEISPMKVGYHNADLSDTEGYAQLRGYEFGTDAVVDSTGALVLPQDTAPAQGETGQWTYYKDYAINPMGEVVKYEQPPAPTEVVPQITPSVEQYNSGGGIKGADFIGEGVANAGRAVVNAPKALWESITAPPKDTVPVKEVKVYNPETKQYETSVPATEKVLKKQDEYKEVIGGVLTREGGYVKNDAGAGETNFGINSKANPGVDIKNLTKDQAIEIYKKNYYDKVVTPDMTLDQQKAIMDAAVNMGPDTAKALWKQAGGDLNKFADLRIERYNAIADKNEEKAPYRKAWIDRANAFRGSKEEVKTEVPPVTPEDNTNKTIPPTPDAINAGPPKTAMQPEGWMSYLSTSIKNSANNIIDTITDPNKAVSALGSFFKDTLGVTGKDAAKFAALYYGQRAMGLRQKGSIEFAGRNVLGQMDQRAQHEARMLEKGYVKNAEGNIVPGGLVDKGEQKVFTFSDGTNAHKPYSFTRFEQGGTGKTVWLDNQGRTPDQVQKSEGNGRVFVPFAESDKPESQAQHYKTWSKDRGEAVEGIINSELGGLTDKQGNVRKERVGIYTGKEFAERGASKLRELGYNPTDPVQQNEMDNIVTNAARDMLKERRANPDAKIKTLDHYIEKNIVMAKTGIDNKLLETSKKDTYTAANKVVEQKDQIESLVRQSNPKASNSEINDKTMDMYKQFQREWTSAPDALKKKHLSTDTESGFYLFVKDRIKEENKRK